MQRAAKMIPMHEAGRACPGDWSRRAGQALRIGLRLAFLLALACGTAGRSQAGYEPGLVQSQMQQMPLSEHPDLSSPDNYDQIMMERRVRALNIERQKQMVAEANKLLKLAQELNDEVAASNTGTLTPEQLHKIAEIEKLARSVKERMASGVTPPQPAPNPPNLLVYPLR
jgi:hypothetical protein